MNNIGKKISETRKLKGLTQEELAELSKVNLRTIQRIENDQSAPHGRTLNLICNVLGLNLGDFSFIQRQEVKKTILSKIINITFLFILNIVFMLTIGYLTLDSEANLNSRVGGFLVSILLPIVLTFITPQMKGFERLIKFGSGLVIYIIISIIVVRLGGVIKTGLLPCLIIAVGILYYGDFFIRQTH